MMKKIIPLMILLPLLMTRAHAGEKASLKTAFDELSYSLTVEWDQEDPAVAHAALAKFSEDVRSAQATDQEMADFFKSLLQGRADAEADQFIRNIRAGALTREAAIEELRVIVALSYAEGTSWIPVKYVVLGAVGGAALIFVAGLLMWELSDPDMFGEDGWK